VNLVVPIKSNSPLNNFVHEKYILDPSKYLGVPRQRIYPTFILGKHFSKRSNLLPFLTIVFFLNRI